MKRSIWTPVIIIVALLAMAGIVTPWLRGTGSASVAHALPSTPVRPTVLVTAASVPASGAALKVTSTPIERTSGDDDRALMAAALSGGAIAVALALVALSGAWWMVWRGGPQRRAIALAGRGVHTAVVARRTQLPQDAVRTLLVPGVASRRRRA